MVLFSITYLALSTKVKLKVLFAASLLLLSIKILFHGDF